jgi:hypothetical protein
VTSLNETQLKKEEASTQLNKKDIIPIEEYRRIVNDNVSPEFQVRKRLQYLEALCRNIIKAEIEFYVKAARAKTSFA